MREHAHLNERPARGRRLRHLLVLCGALALTVFVSAASTARDDVDLVSRASGATGAKGDTGSFEPALSADGRFVAFASFATNLHPDDDDPFPNPDVFVRDLQTDTTTLVSRASGVGGAKGNSYSQEQALSADGRLVAFSSGATNLHPDDDDDTPDVFVRDLQTDTTTLVSRASGATGVKGNGFSELPAISGDGRFVAFDSGASNLHPDDPPSDTVFDVFVRDLQTDAMILVSRASGATVVKGNGGSATPAVSADGRFVAFTSNASNLDPDDDDPTQDVFVRDLQTDTTTLVSRATGVGGAKGDSQSDIPAISADGRFVAFDSRASNLHPDDGDPTLDVFVRDLETDATILVSRASGAGGAKANGASFVPAVSGDGRFVAFQSQASNLHPDDDDPTFDVFVRDLQTNTTTLVSRAGGAAGAKGNGGSDAPAVSADGRFVAFQSQATNLHPADDDTNSDVFRRQIGNSAPGAAADAYATVAGTALTVAAPGVLANDSDPDGDALSALLVAGPAHGTLALGADGSFTYSPGGGYVGPDSFSYRASDGVDSQQATASITVNAAPPPPPPAPPPPPPPRPRPPAPPARPVSAVLRVQVLGLSVFGRAGSEARCRMRVGRIRSCTVRLLAGRRVLAEGSRRARGGRSRSLLVRLRLTGYGQALLERRLGGVRTRVRARGLTSGGVRRARARTRALLRVERFTTPPGSFAPDEAVLTARGERFLRSLRGRLIAVASLRCEGHSADVRAQPDSSPLSLARAAAFCQALRQLGVRARPRLAGLGDSEPLASNESESGRAENRRVEVTVTHRVRHL